METAKQLHEEKKNKTLLNTAKFETKEEEKNYLKLKKKIEKPFEASATWISKFLKKFNETSHFNLKFKANVALIGKK